MTIFKFFFLNLNWGRGRGGIYYYKRSFSEKGYLSEQYQGEGENKKE
jgi:hypothetical protein